MALKPFLIMVRCPLKGGTVEPAHCLRCDYCGGIACTKKETGIDCQYNLNGVEQIPVPQVPEYGGK